MADATVEAGDKPKRGKLPLLIGVLLALILGAAGFFVTYSGKVPGLAAAPASKGPAKGDSAMEAVFVPVPPLIVSLVPTAHATHLRFTAQLEVNPASQAAVTRLMPRILDVMNTYLRAVEPSDLEQPSVLVRLRAQLLRRIQIVTGEGSVRDLLVTEFALN
ncbi:MAG: flagellar basal body-associated FliL family protein [Paracoccaceae bacterium]|nr:flagellar basal body-associated FliL family protein [Paracoccaceae bacterium]